MSQNVMINNAKSVVARWANGREVVSVRGLCRAVGIRQYRRSDPFPISLSCRGRRHVASIDAIAEQAPPSWLQKIAAASPLPVDEYEVTLAKVAEFMPRFVQGEITMAGIARNVGLTRERVRQIMLAEFGVTAHTEKIVSVRNEKSKQNAKARLAAMVERRQKKDLSRYGATEESLFEKYGPDWKSTFQNYLNARRNSANNDGAEWNITYADWLDVWRTSKALPGTGRLCFARIDRNLPYQPGNLRLIRISELIKEVRMMERALHKQKRRHE